MKNRVYVVHADRFFVDGKVFSSRGLQSLALNGVELLLAESDDDDAQGVRFSSSCFLHEGTNLLQLVATDTAENTNKKVLTVIRTPPAYVRQEYRLAASIPPLYASRNQSDGYTWQVKNR